jgi:hypothetical protein
LFKNVTFEVFLSLRRVGFHEEWLRDEPFDATTTGQLLGTGVNSLLVFPGYMRFSGKYCLYRLAAFHETLRTRNSQTKRAALKAHHPSARGEIDVFEWIRIFLYGL